jgi:UDP-glucose 4-epimerase
MKYLVTGGAGFIGSHLSEALLSRGHHVVSLDDFTTGSPANLETIQRHPAFSARVGSITDAKLVNALTKEVDGIFHMAAAVGVQKILDDPIGSLKTNINGTEIVLEAAAIHNKRALLASTSEIYGKNSSGPLTEESDRILGSPLLARWTYSEAKAIDEAFARHLFEKTALKVQIVRLFNTVGPRQSPAYGMVIPRFFHAALSGEPLIIHGDGSQQRVFCHVADAIAGILALWESEEGYGEAFNLGGIEETSIIELAEKILRLTQSNSPLKFISYEELAKTGFEDIARRIPVIKKLQDLTGWKPTLSLDEILADFFTELKSHSS